MDFEQPPLPWSDIIARSPSNRGKSKRGWGHASDLLLQVPDEHGNVPKIFREDEGVDGGANAEDQSDVGENKDTL